MRIRAFHRIAAVVLAKLMLLDICYPTLAFALTGGPSQPEFESFEPVSTDQMVDLFSGDFTYNIPLMTVPGPNGGYPINLAYHAGIGMEQEASWVGLGWNINVGEINRMMRGLPDDLAGDPVEQVTNIRDNNTFGVEFGSALEGEVFGLNIGAGSQAKAMLYVNNYKGVGIRTGVGLVDLVPKNDQNLNGVVGSFSTTFDSQSGLEMAPGIGLLKQTAITRRLISFGPKLHSRYGVYDFDASWTKTVKRQMTDPWSKKVGHYYHTTGAGISFGAPAYIPAPFAPMRGMNFKVGLRAGGSIEPTWLRGLSLTGLYASEHINHDDITRTAAAYGYLHSEDRSADPKVSGLMDYHRDKDVALTRRNPYAPMPVYTYDSYLIKGQGTGGSFRPYRSDIGLLTQDPVRTASDGSELHGEVGAGTGWKIGFDGGYVRSRGFSGGWRSGVDDIAGLKAYPKDPVNDPLYEPFYFRLAGEQTAAPLEAWNNVTNGPLCFDLGLMMNIDVNLAPKVRNTLVGSNTSVSVPKRTEREKRVNNIEYRTVEEILTDPMTTAHPMKLYSLNEVAGPTNGTPFSWNESETGRKHLGEIAVLNPDGTRYVYGLPAYNTTQQDYAFSIDPTTTGNPPTIAYQGGWGEPDDLKNNTYGQDHFFSKTTTPAYAHSFLLTAVYSADYVDVTGDGPTDDDLGYYVKFNYTPVAGYKWRVPFREVNYVKGKYSNKKDDKATFSYGEKETYYLNSIETSTHIARFTLGDRQDGYGATGPRNTGVGVMPHSLQGIDLYSKAAMSTALKSVRFNYDYELCPGVDNRTPSAPTGGKLTLKSLFFTYLGNDRGSLTPYRFAYANATLPYVRGKMDRWGTPTDKTAEQAMEWPYVDQIGSAEDRNALASAWCLNEITMPSGSVVHVEYEADDYAYVQDKPAMQMCRILGTSDARTTAFDPGGGPTFSLKHNDRRIYFEMNDPDDDPQDYVRGVRDVYFKTWQRLKQYPVGNEEAVLDWAYDYVDGYARPDPTPDVGKIGGTRIGYFTVEEKRYNSGVSGTHPFRLAGWQYLRYERPDLLYPPNDLANNTVVGTAMVAAVNLMLSSFQMLAGFYNYASARNWCEEMKMDGTKPSFIRLNSPARWDANVQHAGKFGGGHRVSRITVTDGWEEGSAEYGKSYEYRMRENGRWISSGVAEYEPQLGGEEIALRNPVWYNGSDARISFRHEDAYIETPLGESLYPAPGIGYRQVIVRDIVDGDEADLQLALNGAVVHEFYTALDFPVRVFSSSLESVHYAPPQIPIPFVGAMSFNSHGYSQGYSVELNDMHGRPRAVATYAQGAALSDPPRTRTAYYYKTDPDDPQVLDNTVDVLYDHFEQERAELGRTMDVYVDLQENSDRADMVSTHFNLDFVPIFAFAMGTPAWEQSVNLFRSVVTNKVIQRTGVLDHVVSEVDGARTTTTNLMFDAYTGEPLLTSTTNAWDDPVYTYKYAAHMAYDGMAGAFRNWGAHVRIASQSPGSNGGVFNVTDASSIFYPGDEVVDVAHSHAHYWVDHVTSGSITLKTAGNTNAPDNVAEVRIARSGHRNMQSISSGSIVSLSNPLEEVPALHPIFQGYNEQVFQQPYPAPNSGLIKGIYSCKLGWVDVRFGWLSSTPDPVRCLMPVYAVNNDGVIFREDCSTTIVFNGMDPNGWDVSETPNLEFLGFTGELTEEGDPILQMRHWQGGTYVLRTGYWLGFNECFGSDCLKDVLHADATEFKDQWSYDYGDAGIADLSGNAYRYGTKGIWRPWKSHLFQVDRRNTYFRLSDIRKEGPYKSFEKFDFATPGSNSARWVKREEMTRYSPFGFALESLDALSVPSCALYGYSNSQMVAQATAAGYHEVAFEGFEDHPATYESGHGHMDLRAGPVSLPIATPTLISDGHTGRKCAHIAPNEVLQLSTTSGSTVEQDWIPLPGKRYLVSAWFKTREAGQVPTITILDNGSPLTPVAVHDGHPVIEGWQKVEVEFIAPATGHAVKVRFHTTGATGNAYLDDARISPAQGSMQSYVYDRGLHRLQAQLDERNYATFYNYDEQGALVQVKQETERGVVTLRTSRKYIAPIE